MLSSIRTTQPPLVSQPAVSVRTTLLVLVVTAALLSLNMSEPSSQTLHIGTPAAAYGETAGGWRSTESSADASADAGTEWGESDWGQWEAQVREVQAPVDVAAGRPLRIDVNAVDPGGLPLSNARVEVTWVLSGHEYEDVATTGIFGNASVTRTIGSAYSGKRCVVAVAVEGDKGWGCAYSAFSPK